MFRVPLALIAAVVLTATPASAATIIYDNGPISGVTGAYTISDPYAVSNSFDVSTPATLGSAVVGLWVEAGVTPTGLDWAVGTSQGASDVSAGASALSNVFFTSAQGGSYDVYSSTFSLSGVLGVGTYWLTLQLASASPLNSFVYWDFNGGPSTAFQNGGQLFGSNSFTLYAEEPSQVPEPATLLLVGSGLAMVVRRRFQAKGSGVR